MKSLWIELRYMVVRKIATWLSKKEQKLAIEFLVHGKRRPVDSPSSQIAKLFGDLPCDECGHDGGAHWEGCTYSLGQL